MWTKQLKAVEKGGAGEGKALGIQGLLKNTNSLLEVVPMKAFGFPKTTAQNKGRKVMHISTPLIVVTSIYI